MMYASTIPVHWEKGEQMGKPRMIGQFKPYMQNREADMRFRKKAYLRNKERVELCSYCRHKKGKVKVL